MAMKVILNQDVPNLGEEGDVKSVANGYGRNYLLPKGIAFPYTKKYINMFEQKKDHIIKKKEEKRVHALSMKDQIESIDDFEIKVPAGETGKLFGSVNNAVIADTLAKYSINIERKKIEIPEHNIKMTGVYSVKIKLYNNESANLKVTVAGAETTSA